MDLDGLALDKLRLKRLDAQTVQGRRTVQQNGPLLDNLLKHLPHLGLLALDDALGALYVRCVVVLDQPADDEGPVQFQCHRLRQAALVQLQLRADDDHRAARVVDTLTEQVAAEAPLLALQHVAQRLQFAAATAAERPAPLAVVDEAVDSLLQHALLVANNHVRRAKLQQALETVVAVDDPAIQVVQVRRRKATAVKLNHRAQVRRDHRQHRQDHPLGAVAALAQCLDHAQALRRLLAALLRARRADLVPQLLAELVEVHRLEDVVERARAHPGLEHLTIAGLQLAVARLAEELHLLQRLKLLALFLVALADLADALLNRVLDLRDTLGNIVHDFAALRRIAGQRFLTTLLDVSLEFVQRRPGNILHTADMLRADDLTRLDDDVASRVEDQRLICNFPCTGFQHLLEVLRRLHQLVCAGREFFVKLLVHEVAAVRDLSECAITSAFDHADLAFSLGPQRLNLGFHLFLQPLERLLAGILVDVSDNILREIKHTVEIATGDIRQQAEVAWHTARIPDVRHRCSQLNVPHALATNRRACNLNPALVARQALVADVLILPAVALPVAGRAKDGLTEQSVFFRAEAAIVNGFRLGNLTIRPRTDFLRRGEADAQRPEILRVQPGFLHSTINHEMLPPGQQTTPRATGKA